MKWLSRIISVCLVVFLFGLTLKNTQTATFYFYGDIEFQEPMIVVVVCAFLIGCLTCFTLMLPALFRNYREQMRLKKQISGYALQEKQNSQQQQAQTQEEKSVEEAPADQNNEIQNK